MQLLRLLVLFIVGLISSLLFSPEQAFAVPSDFGSRTINDSLVQNLQCENLSVDSIYRAIREDAFDERRNIPMRNRPFRYGLTTIAGCWGFSSTQRMISYLARYNTTSIQAMPYRVMGLLDMVRGQSLTENNQFFETDSRQPFVATDLKKYSVFAVEESTLADGRYELGTLWNSLLIGYTQMFNGVQIVRSFREEIEANQVRHFFRSSNIKMGLGTGALSAGENHSTWQQLKKNLDGRRLTLLNLRGNRTTQHIVMAKSYRQNSNGLVEIMVYDSNTPERDAVVFFESRSGAFVSPQVFRDLLANPMQQLGVYIVDESERIPLEKAMLAHYTSQCR